MSDKKSNLILINKPGQKILDFGKVENYEINGQIIQDQGLLNKLWDDTIYDLKLEIDKFIAYSPQDLEELDDILERINKSTYESANKILRIAMMQVILNVSNDQMKKGFKIIKDTDVEKK